MKKQFILLLLTALLSGACERDQDFLSRTGDLPLLYRVLIDGEAYQEYTYTSAGLISEEKSRFFYTKHSYNAGGLLTKSEFYMDPRIVSSSSYVLEEAMKRKDWVDASNTPKSLTKTYEYNDNGHLNRINFLRASANNNEYSAYTWENDRISRQTMYWQNELSGYIDFEYDDSGNVIRETKYSVQPGEDPELVTTTEYEYDNMRNPFLSFSSLLIPGKHTNPNNITKETYTIHFEVDNYIQRVQSHKNSYKYNKDGYPVEVNGEAAYIYK